MIKMREAKYCNLKLLLIFLVVYGHMIEPRIWESKIIMLQYRGIYLIHMPLFSFLSGLFINKEKDCRTQLKRMLPIYIILQAVAVFLGKGEVKLLTPYWHLWYLLSYCFWLCLAWLWFRLGRGKGKRAILICSIVIGCISGFLPFIGRVLSLSRTLVFFPYFWLGFICNPAFHWKKLRMASAISLLGAFVSIINVGDSIPVEFLYHADSFANTENGVVFRIVCYVIGMAFALFLLVFMPEIRFPFTRIGANTMPVYLIHAPIVLYLQKCSISWEVCLIVSMLLIYGVDLLMRWHSDLYGIIAVEGRESRWLHFKKFMKTMHSQYIDSYSP